MLVNRIFKYCQLMRGSIEILIGIVFMIHGRLCEYGRSYDRNIRIMMTIYHIVVSIFEIYRDADLLIYGRFIVNDVVNITQKYLLVAYVEFNLFTSIYLMKCTISTYFQMIFTNR